MSLFSRNQKVTIGLVDAGEEDANRKLSETKTKTLSFATIKNKLYTV